MLIDDHGAVATVVGSSHDPRALSLLLSFGRPLASLERGESRQRVVGDSVFYLYSSTPSFVVSTVEPFRCSDVYMV